MGAGRTGPGQLHNLPNPYGPSHVTDQAHPHCPQSRNDLGNDRLAVGEASVRPFRELLVAGQGGGQAEEDEEVRALSFVSDGEAAVAEEPGDRPLDLPAVPTEAFAGLDAGPRDARDEPALAQPGQVFGGEVRLVRAEFDGRRRRGPRRDRTAGMPRMSGLRAKLSCMFAPDTATASGMPWASDSTCSLLPFLPRSTGFGPVSDPRFWRERRPCRRSPRSSPPRPGPRVRPAPPGAADARGRPRSIP